MIDASLIRRGNILGRKLPGITELGHVTVETIKPNLVGVIDKDGKYHLLPVEDLRPIPLTEELLLKFGFEKHQLEDGNPNEGYYYSISLSDDKYCDLSLLNDDKNGICEVCLFPYTETFRYQYVHQLQNLYQSLTGTELKPQP